MHITKYLSYFYTKHQKYTNILSQDTLQFIELFSGGRNSIFHQYYPNHVLFLPKNVTYHSTNLA